MKETYLSRDFRETAAQRFPSQAKELNAFFEDVYKRQPWNDAEKARMQALNKRDVSIDYAFMVTVEKIMRHGCENVPDYMLSGSRGDFTGVGDVHLFYSADEVLYGALPDLEEACKRANIPYTVSARPKMVHCYCMLPIFKEAKEDFAKIVEILEK